jgi:hypothetical protein
MSLTCPSLLGRVLLPCSVGPCFVTLQSPSAALEIACCSGTELESSWLHSVRTRYRAELRHLIKDNGLINKFLRGAAVGLRGIDRSFRQLVPLQTQGGSLGFRCNPAGTAATLQTMLLRVPLTCRLSGLPLFKDSYLQMAQDLATAPALVHSHGDLPDRFGRPRDVLPPPTDRRVTCLACLELY